MRNPIRRSRNIGKTQGGRVSNGKAHWKWSTYFGHSIWDQLSEDAASGDMPRIFVENPSRTHFHPCNPEEYLDLIKRLPDFETKYLKAIVLRRTSKSDQKLGVEARRRFSCVLINAFPRSLRLTWSKTPSEFSRRHYEPWCNTWGTDGSKWWLEWTLEEIRRYYLFHLFLHELGHINQPAYHSLKRREDFAENYALEMARKLGELA